MIGIGYLGSELLKFLSNEHQLIALDKMEIAANLKKYCTRTYKGDILDESLLDKAIKDCDVVINLSGGGGNISCLKNPLSAVNTYVVGMQKLVRKAEERSLRHLILASSIAVYPFRKDNEFLTEETPPAPKSIYGILKLCSERVLEEGSVKNTVFRMANLYGYTENNPLQPGGALGNFIDACFADKDIIIYGDGSQELDYLHISDVCNCIRMQLKTDLNKNYLYNIGSANPLPLLDIAKEVLALGKKYIFCKNEIKKVPQDTKSESFGRLSITKINNDLQWQPKVDLRAGITEMIEKYCKISKKSR